MNSRDRFSLGARGRVVVAVQPDQHGRIDDHGCGQVRESGRWPRPAAVSFCSSISCACRTFCTLVAKWPCQNQVSRSISWSSARTIRSSHHSVAVCCSSRRSALRCLRSAGSASSATRSASGRSGVGVAAAPWSIGRGRRPQAGVQPGRASRRAAAGQLPGPAAEPEPLGRPADQAAARPARARAMRRAGPAAPTTDQGRAFSGSTGTHCERIDRAIAPKRGALLATVDEPDRPVSTEGTSSDRSAPARRRRVRRDRQRGRHHRFPGQLHPRRRRRRLGPPVLRPGGHPGLERRGVHRRAGADDRHEAWPTGDNGGRGHRGLAQHARQRAEPVRRSRWPGTRSR